MKKRYMTPALTTVHVNTVNMMATSPAGGQVYNEQADEASEGFTKDQGDWDIWD